MGKLNLENISWASQNALQTKDADTLYFISDKNVIYARGAAYGTRTEVIPTDPVYPEMGVVYINTTTLESKIWNGTGYTPLSLGFTTTVSDDATNNILPTAKAVADFVDGKIAGVVGGNGTFVTSITANGNGGVTVAKGTESTDVTLTNTVYSPVWDSTLRKLTLPVAGGKSLEVDLSRDLVVKAGKYNDATDEIWLSIAEDGSYTDSASVIKIPVGELVDIYTGGTTSTATVTIGADRVVKVDVKISSKAGNSLSVDGENGLYVTVPDDTTKANKVETGKTDELLVADATGDLKASGKKVGGSTLTAAPNANTVATELAVKTYADGVAQSAVSTAAGDATTKANTAESNAKAYADELITWKNW